VDIKIQKPIIKLTLSYRAIFKFIIELDIMITFTETPIL